MGSGKFRPLSTTVGVVLMEKLVEGALEHETIWHLLANDSSGKAEEAHRQAEGGRHERCKRPALF